MSDEKLDAALSTLPREVEPSRDLWPAIQAGIRSNTESTSVSRRRPGFGMWGQLAAGVVLAILSVSITYVVMRQSSSGMTAMSGKSSAGDAITAEYLRARAELDRQFAERLAALPPDTRAKFISSVRDVRRAADEILADLIEHPTDPLLHELLMSTYQSESQLLASAVALSLTKS